MNADNYSQTSAYSQPIARELVHKRSIAEVLITSVTTTPATWICHAQLTRRHSFHTDTTGAQRGYYDPLLVLEAFRQACIAASHASYGVPLDARYTVRYYELSILDAAALKCGPHMLDLEFDIAVRNEFRRGGDGPVRGLDVAAVVTHEGTKVMELSTSFGWMSRAKWEEFRADASWDAGPQASPADPRIVGRTRPENVVIGEPVPIGDGAASAPIVVDLSHPTMFDHPLDHLPGGLIIEACRQLSLAVLGSGGAKVMGPAWLRCDFQSFAELDATNTVTVAPAAGDALSFWGEVTQSGQTKASVELTFATGDGGDGMWPST
jgi:2-oxo-3-(phosphooxy)propyl 3-oxoalkanoate synthase